MDNKNFAQAVALDSRFVRECFQRAALRVVDTKLGNWSGFKGIGRDFQEWTDALSDWPGPSAGGS